MTYFGFLALFIGIPLLALALLHWRDYRNNRQLPASLNSWHPGFVIAAHVVVALIYTTPWDNYLVATNVWWYDPSLVTGIVLGWVPLEEYTFFVLQTVLSGMLFVYLARRLAAPAPTGLPPWHSKRIRLTSALFAAICWLASLGILASGWQPGTYLGLEIVWAFPPIIFQLAFGGDILWRQRRLVFWALVPVTIYLCIADAIAIGSGTWTIDPAQSTGVMVGNLPLEEILFFLLTNTLIVFGATLVLAEESQARAPQVVLKWMARISNKSATGTTEAGRYSHV